jgi:hypothetical protein
MGINVGVSAHGGFAGGVLAQSVVRRHFLKLVAVAGVGVPAVVFPGRANAAVPSADEAFVGRVVAASPGQVLVRTPQGTRAVTAGPGARMYSGAFGEVEGTGAFIVGDRVAVEGVQRGQVVEAVSIGSTFTALTATVQSVSPDGGIAHTDAGTIELHAGRLPFTPQQLKRSLRSGAVRLGDVLTGLGWTHPTAHEHYMLINVG